MYHGNLAAALVQGRMPGRPKLLWNIRHSLSRLSLEPFMTQQVIRLLARLSPSVEAIVYCSQASRTQHEAIGFASERGVVIANGLDTEMFQPDPTAAGRLKALARASDEAILIGAVARVDPMKGHATLLKAAAVLRDKGLRARIVLMGRDADGGNAMLTGLIREQGLRESVSLLGQRDDVAALMPGFDIVVSSSAWGEAFPNVVGEAMACGVPCIVTDVGDSAQVVGETGLVVPPADPLGLARALEQLMRLSAEERRSLGDRARTRVASEFSLEKMKASYEALYSRIAHHRPGKTGQTRGGGTLQPSR